MKLIAAYLCVIAMGTITEASLQSVKVVGKLLCGSKAYSDALIKLVDHDTGPNPDDLMQEGKPTAGGTFTIEGQTNEATRIDPRVEIYHDCDDGWKACQRKLKIKVPKKYINEVNSDKKKKVFDVGTIQLELKTKGESRDCFH